MQAPLGFARLDVAAGSPMEALVRLAERVAASDLPVLIEGETGTGKTTLARALHETSRRQGGPFRVASAALPLADALGASAGGTLVASEIAEAPPAAQAGLVEAIDAGTVRVIATTRAAEGEVRAGRLRPDLYWRLAGATLALPPLRERRIDLPLLAEAMTARAMAAQGRRVDALSREILDPLLAHDWPGNLHELAGETGRLVLLSEDGRLSAAHLSPRVRAGAARADEPAACVRTLKARVEAMEARVLREALARHHGNKSRAAADLGLSRVGLRAKLERYGIAAPARPEPAEPPLDTVG